MRILAASAFDWFWSNNGRWYNFWSGFGSNLTLLGLFGVAWRRINCHVKGCWRIGKHHVDGTPYIVCKRHHPHVPDTGPTANDIKLAHKRAEHLSSISQDLADGDVAGQG